MQKSGPFDISLSKGIYLIQPVLTDLSKTSFDPELSPGAHNAVYTCLRIQPSEKVTIITDNESREIAASIAAELQKLGAPFKAFVAGVKDRCDEQPVTTALDEVGAYGL